MITTNINADDDDDVYNALLMVEFFMCVHVIREVSGAGSDL
jgi:hypothetical protein